MLPANVARELLLTGGSLPAERAERLGFVNLVTDPARRWRR
jgi:enoyl-CoA hydratase